MHQLLWPLELHIYTEVFNSCGLGDMGTLTNKLRSGVHLHHCQQPKDNVPLLDSLTQVPIRVLVLVLALVQVQVLLPAQVLLLNRSPHRNPNIHLRNSSPNPSPRLGLESG